MLHCLAVDSTDSTAEQCNIHKPTRTCKVMLPHHHRINHTPMYFNGLLLTTVTLASTNNVLPYDGVTAPKHVRAFLM